MTLEEMYQISDFQKIVELNSICPPQSKSDRQKLIEIIPTGQFDQFRIYDYNRISNPVAKIKIEYVHALYLSFIREEYSNDCTSVIAHYQSVRCDKLSGHKLYINGKEPKSGDILYEGDRKPQFSFKIDEIQYTKGKFVYNNNESIIDNPKLKLKEKINDIDIDWKKIYSKILLNLIVKI